jgi:uncharacterized membrane protein YeaQ/YmgE (transglycosylase-associated protein family)
MLLADLFTLDLNIGSGFFTLGIDIGKSRALADFFSMTVSVAGYTITYNIIDLLVILGISVIATVMIEKLAKQTTPGGFLGGFLIALIGIWLFITLTPPTWNQDLQIPTTHVPLLTAFIGAVLSILAAHLFRMAFSKKAKEAKA